VIFVHSGDLIIEVEGETALLSMGDTVTVPVGAVRRLSSSGGADLFVTRGGDAPLAVQPVDGAA
jgi:mannose-6-phosphate isomerase-like protein (cupin superfamily)